MDNASDPVYEQSILEDIDDNIERAEEARLSLSIMRTMEMILLT